MACDFIAPESIEASFKVAHYFREFRVARPEQETEELMNLKETLYFAWSFLYGSIRSKRDLTSEEPADFNIPSVLVRMGTQSE